MLDKAWGAQASKAPLAMKLLGGPNPAKLISASQDFCGDKEGRALCATLTSLEERRGVKMQMLNA